MGESHYERGDSFPGAKAQALGALPAVGYEHLALVEVACVFDRVFVFIDKVLVVGLTEDCYFYLVHFYWGLGVRGGVRGGGLGGGWGKRTTHLLEGRCVVDIGSSAF